MVIIIASLVFSEYSVQKNLRNQRFDAAEVNFSGRQRMLSQRLTKNVSLLQEAITKEEVKLYLKELAQDLADFKAAQHALIYGNTRLELDASGSEIVLGLFKEANIHFEAINGIVGQIIKAGEDSTQQVQLLARKRLPTLLKAEQAFLPMMEDIVRQFSLEAKQNNEHTAQLSWRLTVAVVLLIILQAFFVFLPAIRRLHSANKAVIDSVHKLTEQNSIQGELNDALKLQQLALEKNVAILERKNKELDQFTYIASHDLKTPLRAVSNLSVWLESELGSSTNPEVTNHLKMMRERILRMENLINGVLDYASISKLNLSVEAVNCDRLLHMICEEEVIGKARFDFKGKMPTIQTASYMLEQVFRQLIRNAVQHNDDPQPMVEISYHGIRENHVFCIKDNGPGILPEFHEKVFQMFQTLKSKDEHDATGIGLSIAKKIVEERGGEIWIANSESKGTSFWFTWPEVRN
ncbi:MAG: ATP-binding protein [Sphingobacteriaceae bacterium]|nr:ATP-binding protein [Sphingobacteriaceae bacterium]